MNNTMKGLFFIVKGQYRKDTSPRVTNEDGKTYSLGGYDPECEDTMEHYQLMDNITFRCLSSGTLDSVLKSLEVIVKRHKGKLDHYLKGVKVLAPVSHSELFIRKHVYEEFGYFYEEEVEEVVDTTLASLVNFAYKKAKKVKKKLLTPHTKETLVRAEEKKKRVVEEPHIRVRHKKVKPVKRLTSGVRFEEEE